MDIQTLFGIESLKDEYTLDNLNTKDNAKSRIDRIYVNDEHCNEILSCKQIHTPFRKAHKIVTFTLKEENERCPGF